MTAARRWLATITAWLTACLSAAGCLASRLVMPHHGRHCDRLAMIPALRKAKLAFGTDADGPGGPLEHLPSCDGTCGGAVAHAAHLDDGWCPCCYCAQYAVTPTPAPAPVPAGQDQDPAVPPQPGAAPAPAPKRGAATLPQPLTVPTPPGLGQPNHHPWVITQPPPGSPLGSLVKPLDHPLMPGIPVGRVTLTRPDGRIEVSERGHVTVVPETATEWLKARGDWRETRPQAAAQDPDPVPRWYRAWLAAHPEAEVSLS